MWRGKVGGAQVVVQWSYIEVGRVLAPSIGPSGAGARNRCHVTRGHNEHARNVEGRNMPSHAHSIYRASTLFAAIQRRRVVCPTSAVFGPELITFRVGQSALGAVCGEGITSSASRTHRYRASRGQHTANRCQRLPPTPGSRLSRSLHRPDSDDDCSVARAPPSKSTRHAPATHTTRPCPRGPRTAHACLSQHALHCTAPLSPSPPPPLLLCRRASCCGPLPTERP